MDDDRQKSRLLADLVRKLSSHAHARRMISTLTVPSVGGGAPKGRMTSPVIQPLLATTPWTWPKMLFGQTSLEQWNFCDRMPASSDSDAAFSPTSGSFTQNYSALLKALDLAKLKPFSKDISDALSEVALPKGSVVDDPSPTGWTKVPNASGNLEWRLIWAVDSHADDWTPSTQGLYTSHAANELAGNRSMLLSAEQANGKSVPMATDSLHEASVGFESSGSVIVYTGDWYNSFLVGVAKARKNCFVDGVTSDVFFGQNGLLRRRVGGLLIGSNPTVSWKANGPIERSLLTATSVSLGGVTVTRQTTDPLIDAQADGDFTSYSVKPVGTELYILAVVVTDV